MAQLSIEVESFVQYVVAAARLISWVRATPMYVETAAPPCGLQGENLGNEIR